MKALLLIFIPLISCISFNFTITGTTVRCLGDHIPKDILTVYEITTKYKDVRVRLVDTNGNSVYSKTNENYHKITYSTTDSGNQQLCFENFSNQPNAIQFSYKSGIEAKDYSQLAKKDNVLPIEMHISKLQDKIEQLLHSMISFKELENNNLGTFDNIVNRVFFSSIILLSVMGFITLITLSLIKRFIRERKVI